MDVMIDFAPLSRYLKVDHPWLRDKRSVLNRYLMTASSERWDASLGNCPITVLTRLVKRFASEID